MANPFKFGEIKTRIEETKRVLPVVIAKQAEQHFTESFNKGGLDEHKWDESKRRIEGEKAYTAKPKGISMNRWRSNPTLVGVTGALKRKVSRSIMNATWTNVRLVVDLPYAKFHNEKNNDLAWRPFMIQTSALRAKQIKLIKEKMKLIWKQ
jgi:hypothetical protein